MPPNYKEQQAAPAAAEPAPPQDLHLAEARPPDQNWSRMQPIQITPHRDRLDAEHQRVTIRNNSRDQVHVVIDRHMVGHEFKPGETKHDIDMLTSEIAHFLRERDPSRRDAFGLPKPLHPIEIVGVKLPDSEMPAKPQQGSSKKDARAA
jgi:hypothetical protein